MSRKARIGITSDFLDNEGAMVGNRPNNISILDRMPDVEYGVFPKFLPEVTSEQIQECDMVMSYIPKWTTRTLAGNEQLLSVHRGGVGYDMVDVPALTEAGVMLCITPRSVRRPVATGIIAFLMALSTRLHTKDRLTREGRWAERADYHGIGLRGKTLGSIGVGNIGHEMFMLARPLGMNHIAYDPYVNNEAVADVDVKLVDMDTVLAESDFLNISCPLNEETRGMIGEKEFHKMKKTAFLINTARGPIINEAALIKALREGWIQGAGIDVFEQEPTPHNNPLLKLDNVIVTPHAICFVDEYFEIMWDQILSQISQIINGEVPENVVNRGVLEKPQFQSKLKKFQESRR
jgi:phosphoglycerate dehydrogenase-like enzyme